MKRLREHHGSTSPKNGRPEVATTTKKTNNFHQLSNFESSKLWYLFISIQLPLIHTSPIHSPSIRTGDVGEGRSVGTGTSLGDLGAELDIKAEASGGSCFTTLTISRFCTNLESHPIWGIFICIYIYIRIPFIYIYESKWLFIFQQIQGNVISIISTLKTRLGEENQLMGSAV